jgi:hypothetical protein
MSAHSPDQTIFSISYRVLFLESKFITLDNDYDVPSKYSELFDLPDFVSDNNNGIFYTNETEAQSSL